MKAKRFLDNDLIRGTLFGALTGLVVVLAVVLDRRPETLLQAVPTATVASPSEAEARGDIRTPKVSARQLDLTGAPASPDARRLAHWVVATADNGLRPFVILDKQAARIFVFDAEGRLLGHSPVLLGYARGDHSVPGIGQRAIEQIHPEERTTPAGRFVAEPGRNHLGEEVVWVDYDAAVSMHRMRLTDPSERRAERLASPTSADNRISYGCVNLPVDFFEQVLWPMLRDRPGIVYVMPEELDLDQVFPALAATPDPQATAPLRL